MQEVKYKAQNQFLLQLFVVITKGLPGGYHLYIIPQDIVNVISLCVSLAGIIFGMAECSLYEMYDYEPRLLNTLKFAFIFTLPNIITDFTILIYIILYFFDSYAYSQVVSHGDELVDVDKYTTIDVIIALLLKVFTSSTLNVYVKEVVKENTIRDAKLVPSAYSSDSIFKLFKKKYYMRCLIILMKKTSSMYFLVNLFLGLVIFWYTPYDEYIDEYHYPCDYFPSMNIYNCQQLENRLYRYMYFYFFSLISTGVNVVYYVISSFVLFFIPPVTRIIVNFIFDVLDENESHEMNTHEEETIEAASLYPSEGKQFVCEDKVLMRRNSL